MGVMQLINVKHVDRGFVPRPHRTILFTCRTYGDCEGFGTLRLMKVGGKIVLGPHVSCCCVIELDQDQTTALRDTLTQRLR
jgi:hypothetical protein